MIEHDGLREVGGVWINAWWGAPDDAPLKGHAHGRPHATIVLTGRLRLTVETPGAERVEEIAAPAWFAVAPHDLHTIAPLEPDTRWLCVFAGLDGI